MNKFGAILILLLLVSFSFSANIKGQFVEIVKKNQGNDILANALDKGFDINDTNEKGETALMYAVLQNDIVLVKYLLSRDADVNFQDKEGNTALIIAVKKNNIDIVTVLLSKDAELLLRRSDGKSPLHIVVADNNVEMLNLLANQDKPIFSLNNIFDFNLFCELYANKKDDLLIKILDDVDLSLENVVELEYLARIFSNKKVKVYLQNKKEKLLQGEGEFINLICKKRYKEIGRFLQNKKQINSGLLQKSWDIAQASNDYFVLLMLLDYEWYLVRNFNKVDSIIIQKQLCISKFIFNDQNNNFAIDIFREANESARELIKFIFDNREYGAVNKDFVLKQLVIYGFSDELLVFASRQGLKFEHMEIDGRDILYWALLGYQITESDFLSVLLARGRFVDDRLFKDMPHTMLLYSVGEGFFKSVKFLVESGANMEKQIKGYPGSTALATALYSGHYDIAKYLISKGANVNVVAVIDGRKYSLLDFFSKKGDKNAVALLTNAGAK